MKKQRTKMPFAGFLSVAVLGFALVLGGCAMGPDYRRPDVSLPTQFQGQIFDTGVASTPTEVPSRWWVLFNDPELVRLVDLALANNTDLLQAAARVEQAGEMVQQVRAAQLPSVDLAADANRTRASGTSKSGDGGTSNSFRMAGSTSFELDLWGRLRRASESARSQALATKYAHEVVRQTVAGMVAHSYFSLIILDRQITLSRDTLQSRIEELRLQQLRSQGGVVGQLDLEQANGQRADAALQLSELVRQRALLESQIGLLTGQPGIVLSDSQNVRLSLPPTPPADIPSRLLERRPDVRQAEQLLMSANAQIGVAKAEMFPKLSLTALAGGQSDALSSLLRSGSGIWSLGFGLGLPIFDAGRRFSVTEQAKARQVEALAAYQGAVQSAFKDVADALVNLKAVRESQVDAEARDRSALSALNLARKRYAAGYSGSLEQLDAQRTANSAQLQSLSIRQAQYVAIVDLFKALGGGWDSSRDDLNNKKVSKKD